MRIAVIGAGAVGSALAAGMALAGRNVALIARGPRLAWLQQHPLELERDGEVIAVSVPALEHLTSPVDLAILCVKTPALAAAIDLLVDHLAPNAVVLTVQNGVEAHETVAQRLPSAAVVAGRMHGFFEMAGERVRHVAVTPSILFGCTQGDTAAAEARLSEALAGSGFAAPVSPDIRVALWEKFVLAAGLGSVAPALGVPAGQVCDTAEGEALLQEAMEEVAAVGRAAGIALPAAVVAGTMAFARGFPPDATTSLQRDLVAGLPSEYDALTGAVARIAAQHGCPVSVFPKLEAMIARRYPGRSRLASP